MWESASLCLLICPPAFFLLLFFLCLGLLVSLLVFTLALSLLLPLPLSASYSPLHTSHQPFYWLMLSDVVSVKGRTRARKPRAPSPLFNLWPPFFFPPFPHPSWSVPLWYNKRIKPTSPQGLSLQDDHKSWWWQIRLRVKENHVCCVRCRISPL